MHLRAAALALLALALAAFAAPPAEAGSQTVAGWRFDWDVPSGDGGWVVRMSRRGRSHRFAYFYEFWRGNGGVVVGATFARGTCRSGEAGSIVPYSQGLTRAYLDARLGDYLRECPLPRAEAAALRRGARAAWPRFAAFARRTRATMDRETDRIVRHGEPR